MIAPLSTGLVLGKMMPPHLGHLYLIECARRQVERLYVVVEAIEGEPIPCGLRAEWLRALVPGVTVLQLDRHMPQQPSEHPRFWSLWRDALLGLLSEPVEALFASEAYGHRLSRALGARFCPVDPARGVVPTSGTAVRADPARCAAFLPDPVRAHYGLPPRPPPPPAVRVAVVGPESTGKTTLSLSLAAAHGGLAVPEHAHTCITSGVCDPQALSARDLLDFARGQRASEDALSALFGGLLICDSDALSTCLYAERLLGACPPEIEAEAESRGYDATLLTRPDVPWQDDVHRVDPAGREAFFAELRARLDRLGRGYTLLDADPEARLRAAAPVIERARKSRRG